MNVSRKQAVVLIQLGTPDSLTREAVSRFIRSFLLDPNVMDMPGFIRKPLISLVIAPLRSGISLKRYAQIWDRTTGSPLLHYTSELARELDKKTDPAVPVLAAFQYSSPDLSSQLAYLEEKGYNDLIVFPLYPQPAPSTTGSVVAQVEKELIRWSVKPVVRWITPHWNLPGYINLVARIIARYNPLLFDHVIFSYHGLPMKQAIQGYLQACTEMTRQLATILELPVGRYTMAYQSRFGRGWTAPQTNQVIENLPAAGVRSLLVIAPSFTADCLETSWEIGIDFRKRFTKAGGTHFEWVRSLNADPEWVDWLHGSCMVHAIL